MRTTCSTHKWAYTVPQREGRRRVFSVLVQSLLSSYKFDGGSSRRRREGVGRTGGGDHLPRLSRALPRAQDPPLPPLLLQRVRPTTGAPSRAQPPLCVPRVPKWNRFAPKRPRSTAHGVFCQQNERGPRENGENAGKS